MTLEKADVVSGSSAYRISDNLSKKQHPVVSSNIMYKLEYNSNCQFKQVLSIIYIDIQIIIPS
jgi:hypothetical protein